MARGRRAFGAELDASHGGESGRVEQLELDCPQNIDQEP